MQDKKTSYELQVSSCKLQVGIASPLPVRLPVRCTQTGCTQTGAFTRMTKETDGSNEFDPYLTPTLILPLRGGGDSRRDCRGR